jgi:hypothetical protein
MSPNCYLNERKKRTGYRSLLACDRIVFLFRMCRREDLVLIEPLSPMARSHSRHFFGIQRAPIHVDREFAGGTIRDGRAGHGFAV